MTAKISYIEKNKNNNYILKFQKTSNHNAKQAFMLIKKAVSRRLAIC